jgi:hypothetical protein
MHGLHLTAKESSVPRMMPNPRPDSSHYLHTDCRMQGEPRNNSMPLFRPYCTPYRSCTSVYSSFSKAKNLQGGWVIAIGQMGPFRGNLNGGYQQRQVPLGTSQVLR